MKYTLIEKINMECPLCDKCHDVELRKRTTTTMIKDKVVEYEETYYFCSNEDEDENEFETGKMSNENLLNARNAYRNEMGLLTSNDIVDIRNYYGLSQIELAKLLGWGEATISRYESKAIQDETYDMVLRMIKDNPLKALEFLDKANNRFDSNRLQEIKKNMLDRLTYAKESISRKTIEEEYAPYSDLSEYNGYCVLDIDKLEAIISYCAQEIDRLYKVKLMKLLWYIDAESYKENGVALTGLVYQHEKMGALPVGHILDLENVIVNEEIEDDFERIKYRIRPNPNVDIAILSENEIKILDNVISRFKDFHAKEIVDYMHDEIAYKDTNPGDIIPFDLTLKNRNLK